MAVSRELDLSYRDLLSAVIASPLNDAVSAVIVDLRAVVFLDVAGIRTALQAHQSAAGHGLRNVWYRCNSGKGDTA